MIRSSRARGADATPLAGRLLGDFGENITLAHDLEVFAIDFDFAAGVFAEDDLIADADRKVPTLAAIEQPARPDSHDVATLRLLLRGIREHDAPGGDFFGVQRLDHNAVIQRSKFHRIV